MLDLKTRLAICMEALGKNLIAQAASARFPGDLQELEAGIHFVLANLRALDQAVAALHDGRDELAARLIADVERGPDPPPPMPAPGPARALEPSGA